MSYLALLLALLCESVLPDRVFIQARDWMDRFNQELEINLESLGAPSYSHLQWLAPLLVWLLILYFTHQVFWVVSPTLAALLGVVVLLYGLRFRHFAEIFTNAQLFLNQGDFFRARELLLTWMKDYDGSEPVIHRPGELVFQAVYHGSERALRQFFSLIFWFLLVPGPFGVAVYLLTHWSMLRERDLWQLQAFAHEERPTLQQAWTGNAWKAAFTPRFVLYAMEWLPARLLAFTVGLLTQLDDSVLAWRAAKNHSRFSNRAPLTAVFFNAVGLGGGVQPLDVSPLSTDDVLPPSEDSQVQALQRFRQLVLKCALVWIVVALVITGLGW